MLAMRGHCFWQTIAPLVKAGEPGKGETQWPKASGHVQPVTRLAGGAAMLYQVVRAPSDERRSHRHCRPTSDEFVRQGNTCPLDLCSATQTSCLSGQLWHYGDVQNHTSLPVFFRGHSQVGNFLCACVDGVMHVLHVCIHRKYIHSKRRTTAGFVIRQQFSN